MEDVEEVGGKGAEGGREGLSGHPTQSVHYEDILQGSYVTFCCPSRVFG